MAWRYLLEEVPSGDLVDSNLPLSNVSITDTLSGPRGLTGSLPVEFRHLVKPGGGPKIEEWGSAIWAEEDGIIRGGGIVDIANPEGPNLNIECVGFSGQLAGQPYTGTGQVWTQVDPLVVVRAIWDHWQSYPDGNLGVIVDDTTSPVRIGEEQYVAIWTEQAGSDTTFDEGPIRLNHWDVHDLGGFIDDLAKRGGFEYAEETRWVEGALEHRLRLHYPRRGRRRDDLRFVIGENISVVPVEQAVPEGYAGYVMVLGAGEGREKITSGLIGEDTGRLRRVAVVVDDTIKRTSEAVTRARKERAKRVGLREVRDLSVRDHPNAPLGSWVVGDEIRVQGDAGWAKLDTWVRILESTVSPESGDIAQLTVGRSL